MEVQPLYLENLSVGQRFISRSHLINAEQIKRFASEFDPQPFHLNEDQSKQSLFGDLAASGWHTAALTMRLLVESVNLADGIIGAGGEISWPKPTRPDDTLHVKSEIIEINHSQSKPGRGRVLLKCETLNQKNEVVQHFIAKLVVNRSIDSKTENTR